jgi:hypothetical protein
MKGAKCDEHENKHFMAQMEGFYQLLIYENSGVGVVNVMDVTVCPETFIRMAEALKKEGFNVFGGGPQGTEQTPGTPAGEPGDPTGPAGTDDDGRGTNPKDPGT